MLAVHATADENFKSRPDESTTPKEYIAKDFPAIDRAWTAKDYEQADDVLRASFATDRLPRYKSPMSGEVFSRMTSIDNFNSLTDKKIPAADRFNAAQEMMRNVMQLVARYAQYTTRQESYDVELMRLSEFALRLQIAVAQADDDYGASGPGEKVGAELMKGANGLFTGILVRMMLNPEITRTSEATRQAIVLKDLLPQACAGIEPGKSEEVKKALGEAEGKEQNKEFKTALGELIAAMNRTQAPATTGPAHRP